MKEFYVNDIEVSYKKNGEEENSNYFEAEINKKIILFIKSLLENAQLCRLEMTNTDDDLSISVFWEKRFFVGFVDMYNDINYYYNNGCDSKKLVEIEGEVFEERFTGTNSILLWDIIEEFVYKGTKSKKVQWIEE